MAQIIELTGLLKKEIDAYNAKDKHGWEEPASIELAFPYVYFTFELKNPMDTSGSTYRMIWVKKFIKHATDDKYKASYSMSADTLPNNVSTLCITALFNSYGLTESADIISQGKVDVKQPFTVKEFSEDDGWFIITVKPGTYEYRVMDVRGWKPRQIMYQGSWLDVGGECEELEELLNSVEETTTVANIAPTVDYMGHVAPAPIAYEDEYDPEKDEKKKKKEKAKERFEDPLKRILAGESVRTVIGESVFAPDAPDLPEKSAHLDARIERFKTLPDSGVLGLLEYDGSLVFLADPDVSLSDPYVLELKVIDPEIARGLEFNQVPYITLYVRAQDADDCDEVNSVLEGNDSDDVVEVIKSISNIVGVGNLSLKSALFDGASLKHLLGEDEDKWDYPTPTTDADVEALTEREEEYQEHVSDLMLASHSVDEMKSYKGHLEVMDFDGLHDDSDGPFFKVHDADLDAEADNLRVDASSYNVDLDIFDYFVYCTVVPKKDVDVKDLKKFANPLIESYYKSGADPRKLFDELLASPLVDDMLFDWDSKYHTY